MSTTVGALGAGTNTTAYAAVPASASAATTSIAPTASSSAAAPTYSSRLVIDPVAGAITEYTDGAGVVHIQSPSASVVAYLRIGLTAQGLPKPATSVQTA